MRNRMEESMCRIVAESCSLTPASVRTIVSSFFASIEKDARALPFNNHRRIFTKGKFDEYVTVTNIPYIGRIGPSYSRYLKWRANVASDVEQKNRDSFNSRLSQEDIEDAAMRILSGEKVELRKKKITELYKPVWLVGKSGKRQARQVIPKTD